VKGEGRDGIGEETGEGEEKGKKGEGREGREEKWK
jgi:hypothetical protein